MNIIIIIITLLILSSRPQIVLGNNKNCDVFPFFNKNEMSCKPIPESLLEIKTMPEKDISQDSLSCSYSNAYYMAQEYVCYTNLKTRKKQNCDTSSIENKNLAITPIDPLLLTEIDDSIYAGTAHSENKTINSPQHTTIMMSKIVDTYLNEYGFTNNECLNYDAFVNTFGEDPEKLETFFKRISAVLERLRPTIASNNLVEGVASCNNCDADINSIFDEYISKFSRAKKIELNDLAKSSSIKDFMYTVLFESCDKSSVQTVRKLTPILKHIPSSTSESLNTNEIKSKIIDVLKQGRPLTANNYCTHYETKKNGKKECATHALAITGYQRCCDSNNRCQDLVKIKNSWGHNWQKHFCGDTDNNWMYMDDFLNNFSKEGNIKDKSKPFPHLSLSYFAPVEIKKIEEVEALKATKK